MEENKEPDVLASAMPGGAGDGKEARLVFWGMRM